MKSQVLFLLFFSLILSAAEKPMKTAATYDKHVKEITFSGLSYIHYKYDTDHIKEQHTNSFNLNRIYLTAKGDLSEKLSFNVTTDIENSGKDGVKDANLYLKFGFLKYKLTDQIAFSAGVLPSAMLWTYTFWGYRYTGLMGAQEMKIATTADMGIQFTFNINQKLAIYSGVTNGESYKTPVDKNENKNIYLTIITNPIKMLKMSAHIQYELPLQDNDFYEYATDADKATKDASGNKFDLFGQLFVGLDLNVVKIGAEFLLKQNEPNTKISDKVTGMGYAGYIAAHFGKYGIHGKFITFDPDTDTDDDEMFSSMGGVDMIASPNLSVALDWIGKWTGEEDINHMVQISTQLRF